MQAGACAAASLGPIGGALAQDRNSVAIGTARDIQGQLDPVSRLGALEANILRAVCPGLIAFKPGTFDWEPALAKAVSLQSDTVIAFELQPGRRFQDGFGEVTAEDVRFSFERFRVPGLDGAPPPYTDDWAALDRVEVTGPYTGLIRLKAPAPMLWSVVLPDASGCIISRKALEAGAYRTDRQPVRVIGAGPYRFAEWVPGSRAVLRADPGFPGDKPDLAEIVLRPVRDQKTAELALRGDELQFTPIDPQDEATLAKAPHVRALKQPSINLVWIGINVEKAPFSDLRVRQALRAAIDGDQVVEGGWNGTASRADAAIAPGLLGYWEDAPRRARDLAGAKRLLAEAGQGRGFRATLTLLNQPEDQSVGVIVQTMLADAGVELDLDVREPGSFWSAGSGDQGKGLELSLQRFGGKADPAFQLQWFVSSQVGQWNWERWREPAFDELVADAGRTNDAAARARLYVQAQELMDESAAFIWLTHGVSAFAFRDWLNPAVLPNGDDMLFDRFSKA